MHISKDDVKKWGSIKPSFYFLLSPKLSRNMGDYNPKYLFIRCRQLEGTISEGPKTGCWPITLMRVDKGWGSPPEAAWTYDPSESWPPKEPDNIELDLIA